MERRKYMGRAYKDYLKSFESKVIRVHDGDISGYASLMKINEVNRPLVVGDTCLYDNGYSEMIYQPDGEHWRMCALYDDSCEIIEWYVDITRKNAVDSEGNPYCDDLYLDAALLPDGQLLVFDEDELSAAFDSGKVTQYDFDMAYHTLHELQEKKILSIDYLTSLCLRLQRLFRHKKV